MRVLTPAAPSPQARNPEIFKMAQEFEGLFLNAMLAGAFSEIKDSGPAGSGAGGSAWRGMLVEAYAENFSKSGGLGLADAIYKTMARVAQGGGAGVKINVER